jgi:alkylhydroperoxidase/carboxymuconolactone decarboxylase family protein YurZ
MTSTSRQRAEGEARARAEARLRELATTAATPRRSGVDGPPRTVVSSGLDERADALVRLAALVAMSAPATAYPDVVGGALAGGATTEEIIGTIVSVAPTVGISRVVSGTAGLALGLGYDVDAALERRDEPAPPRGTPRHG